MFSIGTLSLFAARGWELYLFDAAKNVYLSGKHPSSNDLDQDFFSLAQNTI